MKKSDRVKLGERNFVLFTTPSLTVEDMGWFGRCQQPEEFSRAASLGADDWPEEGPKDGLLMLFWELFSVPWVVVRFVFFS